MKELVHELNIEILRCIEVIYVKKRKKRFKYCPSEQNEEDISTKPFLGNSFRSRPMAIRI